MKLISKYKKSKGLWDSKVRNDGHKKGKFSKGTECIALSNLDK
jgi:hypothetical protein